MSRLAHHRQRGAALLAAMLIVALVATFAAAALWRQWRSVEIESAERTRLQSTWVLVGALDWSRLILREDARDSRTNKVDHLAEPWAVPLAEARLSTFLAAEKNIASDAIEGLPDAFMSGGIVDAQSRLNVRNLVVSNQPSEAAVRAFTRLFEVLGLPAQEVPVLVANLRRAGAGLKSSATASGGTTTTSTGGTTTGSTQADASGSSGGSTPTSAGGATTTSEPFADTAAPLMPQTEDQLIWLGLSPATVTALAPYVTLLPEATPVNVNTASVEVLAAAVPGLDMAGAQRLVQQRSQRYFSEVSDINQALPGSNLNVAAGQLAVATSYFEVIGRLRLDRIWVQEHSLLKRSGTTVTIVWRHRGAGTTNVGLRP